MARDRHRAAVRRLQRRLVLRRGQSSRRWPRRRSPSSTATAAGPPTAPIRQPAVSRSASGSIATACASKTRRESGRVGCRLPIGVQVYDPFHVIAELDSPARISVPGGGVFAFNWGNLRASVRLAMDFPDSISVAAKGLNGRGEPGCRCGQSVQHRQRSKAHMRKRGRRPRPCRQLHRRRHRPEAAERRRTAAAQGRGRPDASRTASISCASATAACAAIPAPSAR